MSTKLSSHFSDETLEQYAMGNLPAASVDSVEDHLLLCQSCQVRLEQAEHDLLVYSAAIRELQQERASQRSWRAALAWIWTVPKPLWVGALAALLLVAVVPIFRGSNAGVPTEVVLSVARAAGDNQAHAKPGLVSLRLSVIELGSAPSYRMQLVDSAGKEVWQSTQAPLNQEIHVTIPKRLAAGGYWVRLYADGSVELLREFGLNVR